ncbi:MAG: uracil-DNA glycosylase [Thermoplasmata archaeon]|jgi:uracil-DNA glycosylase family 4|nr:uracil-DNA glycosylase [Thermoplasmata archaeon]
MHSKGFRGTESGPGTAATAGSSAGTWGTAWAGLEQEIRSCTKCPLHATRMNAVIYRGSRAPRVVFVGEAPGATEDRLGVPFVGRSGQRLDAALAEAEIPPDDVGILNVIKCRPPSNVFDRTAAATCRPYLDRQLALLDPPVLVSLGAHALRLLDPEAPRVLLAAGHPRTSGERVLFPLIHPAAALRSRALTARWRTDFSALGRWLAPAGSAPAREPI